MVRTIRQDRKGNIWIASTGGIFRYDGKSFTNITSKVSSARFFSVLEDRKGNFWFATMSSGVFYYDGKSFRNYRMNGGLSNKDVHPDDNNVNSIIEDKTGKFWFGTRGNACIYDGKIFTIPTQDGRPFFNVRCIIEDKKGNIWLGGNDGLWRHDGSTFTNVTQDFVSYIYEDKKGNIWTGSHRGGRCALSRYDEKSLSNKNPTVTEIEEYEGMILGILEANDGSIWFSGFPGVRRYDGNTLPTLKVKRGSSNLYSQ